MGIPLTYIPHNSGEKDNQTDEAYSYVGIRILTKTLMLLSGNKLPAPSHRDIVHFVHSQITFSFEYSVEEEEFPSS